MVASCIILPSHILIYIILLNASLFRNNVNLWKRLLCSNTLCLSLAIPFQCLVVVLVLLLSLISSWLFWFDPLCLNFPGHGAVHCVLVHIVLWGYQGGLFHRDSWRVCDGCSLHIPFLLFRIIFFLCIPDRWCMVLLCCVFFYGALARVYGIKRIM